MTYFKIDNWFDFNDLSVYENKIIEEDPDLLLIEKNYN